MHFFISHFLLIVHRIRVFNRSIREIGERQQIVVSIRENDVRIYFL